MARAGSFMQSKAFKSLLNKVYGFGASIVLIGALFKLQHWPTAGLWLVIGLCTEAFVFAISALEPVKEDPDWTLVYPELAGMEDEKEDSRKSVTSKVDQMLEDAKIESELLGKLGDGMKSLSDNVDKMSDITDAAVATDEYANKVRDAASNVDKINESYSNTLSAMQTLTESSNVSKQYFDQIQNATQKLSSLNSVYEMELEESNNHIKALNKYYESLSKTIENITDSESVTSHLKEEFTKLNSNLSNLNAVYGNMLSAMRPNQ